jgi:PTH1 family peptidyl-tRNA hydrolase
MKIILGIGNPGAQYAETRHNIGFRVMDRAAAEHGFGPWRRRFHSLAAEGAIAGRKVLLMKPQTYVNESGLALRAAVDWCHVAPQDVMVVCDDFNLPLGRLRVRGGGSSGGHHGLDSIVAHLNTSDVARLRVGIGGETGGRDRDFVLSRFAAADQETVDEAVRRAARALEVWLEAGLTRCQNEFNADPENSSRNTREEADA